MVDKVAKRREAKVASIIESAWKLARDHGIAGVTLHALAREVGMRQPSLYEYFDSKGALYDAMFADGNRQLLDLLDQLDLPNDPRDALKLFVRAFVEFAVEDPARNELLFLRHIPGFTPSSESYELAGRVLGRAVDVMHDAGVTEEGDIDCVVAMVAGITEAQLSNDPGGDRWTRHLDRYVDDAMNRSTTP
jgi:AcrR family transcriptional regulator